MAYDKCGKEGHLSVCCKSANEKETDVIENKKIEDISKHYYID